MQFINSFCIAKLLSFVRNLIFKNTVYFTQLSFYILILVILILNSMLFFLDMIYMQNKIKTACFYACLFLRNASVSV